jgi:dihydrofolate reductase
MSLDSYIAGPNGEMDWIVWNWDDKLKNYVFELTEPVDTIILGRKMTDGFVSYWSDVMTKPDDPSSIDRSHAFAKKMIETPKVVFTKTLKNSQWPNTDIATGDLTDEITKLKSQNGKDIIVYGGASFDSSLIRTGLIDEFHLFINPVAIGNGMTIFKDLKGIQKFNLVKSVTFDCGIIGLHYEPKRVL